VRAVYTIRTPENVTFELELAGLVQRGLAFLIDLILMLIALIVMCIVTSFATSVVGGFAFALFFVGMFVIQWWYAAIAEWRFRGVTLGKKALGIRTIQEDGTPITLLQAIVRNLLRLVDSMPLIFLGYLVGSTSVLLDRHHRRLGDLAAGTIVVRERRVPMPSAVVPPSERYNSFVNDPSVAMAARRITPPERDALIALGLRREELPLHVRHELFTKLATHLERRLGIARPPIFSEEKFVLNLTAVVLGLAADRRSLPPHLVGQRIVS